MVEIEVLDVNDNAPVFSEHQYHFYTTEGTNVDVMLTMLLQVK